MEVIAKLLANKNLIIGILIFLVILLVFSQIKSCNSNNKDKQHYENTIAALNDSIHKVVNKHGDTVFIQKAAEMTPKDIMNSALFKTLDKQTQAYIKQLAEVKGLLASAKIDLSVKDSIIQNSQYKPETITTDSSVTFKKGSFVLFEENKKNLKVNMKLTFLDSLKWRFDYLYNTEITTTWTREKDKSIKVEYKLDDPKAEVINGKAFYIPADKQKSKLNKTLKTIIWVAVPVVSFSTGMYLGIKLMK